MFTKENVVKKLNEWADNKTAVIIAVIVFFPLGLYLMWKSPHFQQKTKIITTMAFVCFFAIYIIGRANGWIKEPEYGSYGGNTSSYSDGGDFESDNLDTYAKHCAERCFENEKQIIAKIKRAFPAIKRIASRDPYGAIQQQYGYIDGVASKLTNICYSLGDPLDPIRFDVAINVLKSEVEREVEKKIRLHNMSRN